MKIKYGNYSTLSKKLKEKHDKQSKQLSKINENYVSKLNNDDLKTLLDKLLFCQILSLRITSNLFIQKIEFINETLKSRGVDLKKIAEEKDKLAKKKGEL